MTAKLDTESIRASFPMLSNYISGLPMVYLDSAATSLKPQTVIDTVVEYYTKCTSNVKRGVHPLANEASERFEAARESVAYLINADSREIVFVRNTTEAVNFVSQSTAKDTRVLFCQGDHHSNLLPWTRFEDSSCVRVSASGKVDLNDLFEKLTRHKPGLLAVSHVSNAFGGVNPIREIIREAHKQGTRVLVDASQSVPHRPVDVAELDCDYMCFSGHKMGAPSGVGVLYGRYDLLQELEPIIYGGAMVSEVGKNDYRLEPVPWRFEAGTPCIEGVLGLGAACEYLESIGMDRIHSHEQSLVAYALEQFSTSDVTLFGPLESTERSSSITFSIPGIDSHSIAKLLANRFGIIVRSGFHCCQPAHEAIDAPPTVRASFYLYNTKSEIDQLVDAIQSICRYNIPAW